MEGQAAQSSWQLGCSGQKAYEHYIVPAWMGQWAELLVRAGAVEPGSRVLDVACGTGIVARKAARVTGLTGRVAGIDRSGAMIGEARTFAEAEGLAAIAWIVGEASRIPCAAEKFDVVLCQQGLQFFPDRPAALRAMRAVMTQDGRLAISCWRAVERLPLFSVFATVLAKAFGQAAVAVFFASSALSDREDLRALLRDAGFRDIRIGLEVRMARYASLAAFVPGYLSVFPIAKAIAAMPAPQRAELFQELEQGLDDFTDDDGLAVPMESYIVTAKR